jgi:hypothetical protein
MVLNINLTLPIYSIKYFTIVPDHESRFHDTVLMGVHLGGRGSLGGIGILEQGANEQRMGKWGVQFTSKRRPRWTDPVTARRVPSKWKREQGEQGEQGEQKERGMHHVYNLCSCT